VDWDIDEVAPLDIAIFPGNNVVYWNHRRSTNVKALDAFLQRGTESNLALHLAMASDRPEVVELLLSYGYNRNMSTKWKENGELVDISASGFAYLRLHHRGYFEEYQPPLKRGGISWGRTRGPTYRPIGPPEHILQLRERIVKLLS
jgi:hypothetical protein